MVIAVGLSLYSWWLFHLINHPYTKPVILYLSTYPTELQMLGELMTPCLPFIIYSVKVKAIDQLSLVRFLVKSSIYFYSFILNLYLNLSIKYILYYRTIYNMGVVVRFIPSLFLICYNLDFYSFLANYYSVSQLDWSFDSSFNKEPSFAHPEYYILTFDPVREAAADNGRQAEAENARTGSTSRRTNPTGGGPSEGGPSEPQESDRPKRKVRAKPPVRREYPAWFTSDTIRLSNWLSNCANNVPLQACGLEDRPRMKHTTHEKLEMSRIWAHVKADHPEFLNNTFYSYNKPATVNNQWLRNNIHNLNKNYPLNWP